MNRKNRVTDGVRTRDNWSHNPSRTSTYQALSPLRWGQSDRKKPRTSDVSRPRGAYSMKLSLQGVQS